MKKKITSFFSIILFACFTHAQQSKIDSLKNLLKSDKEDTSKVNHLNDLGFENALKGDYVADSVYSSKAMKLSQTLNYNRGIADAYENFGAFYDYEKGDFISAIENYEKALKIYHSESNQDEGRVLCYIGAVYGELKNDSVSLKYLEKALQFARKVKNKHQEGAVLTNIAVDYIDEDNFPMGLEFCFKAMRIYDSIGYKKGISDILGNIGNIYVGMEEYDSALIYQSRALEKVDTDDKLSLASLYLDIGGTYAGAKKYAKAIEYELKGLQLFSELGNKDGIAFCTGNLGGDYQITGEISKAFTYDTIALRMGEATGNLLTICDISNNIGSIYLGKKDYIQAEKYLLKADTLAKTIKSFEQKKNANKNLADLYAQIGQWQKSNHYLQIYADAKDSLFNQDKSKQVGRLEAKFSYDKQLSLQEAASEKSKALADAESKKKNIFLLLIAAIALSIVLIALLIFRTLKSTRKEKLLVERQRSVMELKALRAQMNPHFIFNVINSIQHFILKHDSDSAQEHLSDFSKLIRKVLENSRHETISLAEELKMLELYLELETMRFASKFKYKISLDDSIDKENVFIPPLIIQPYVENAIWHGLMHLKEKQGEIIIKFEKSGDSLKCSIDDNGIGRKQAMELKKGALYESMGLSITKERLQIINMLYQSKMSVSIIDKVDTNDASLGTLVELLIPANFNLTSHA